MLKLSLRDAVVIALSAALLGVPQESIAQASPVATSGTMDPPAVLWKDSGPIASRDLYWGPGSAERAPQGPFTFVEEDSGGTQPKIIVSDGRGVQWEAKFGPETKAEVAANRFVWALGFMAEEVYFVPTGIVQGAKLSGRVKGHIAPEGNFANARFRRRNPQAVRTDDEWTLRENPFVGQKELSGLMILMTAVANWDIGGTRNTRVLRVSAPDGSTERQYAITDLGASFGRMGGGLAKRSKWNLEDYKTEGFVEKVHDGVLHLDYDGDEPGVDRVPVEHARWFASLLAQLTPEQVRRAFEAAGASPQEIEGFSARFLEKITELQAALK
jgi:hypothetical protein